MILVDAPLEKPRDVERLALTVESLDAAGYDVTLDRQLIEDVKGNAGQVISLSPYCKSPEVADIDTLLVLDAERLNDTRLMSLKSHAIAPDAQVVAVGAFDKKQGEIAAAAKISYVSGSAPTVVNLFSEDPSAPRMLAEFGISIKFDSTASENAVTYICPDFDVDADLSDIQTLIHANSIAATILTSGAHQSEMQKALGMGHSIYRYGEVPFVEFAQRSRIVVLAGDVTNNAAVRAMVSSVLLSGGVVVDASLTGNGWCEDVAIRAPANVSTLISFLERSILTNVAHFGEELAASDLCDKYSLAKLLDDTEIALPRAPTRTASRPPRTLFIPTNGVGLGHAQRLSLIASEVPAKETLRFAAFPSCIPMINRYGFDALSLVSRSDDLTQGFANDVVNAARLRSQVTAGDTVVFDGGYVFDSIYRVCAQKDVKSVWVRRGLWKPNQNNAIPLSREKVFDLVISPAEGFEELNQVISSTARVRPVGPIVTDPSAVSYDRAAIRQALREQFDRDFDRLTVTMLGGGVASDRSAQVNAVAAAMDRRDDTLNLIVVWPTANVHPAWYHWKNSHPVKTHHALPLLCASDLLISAVGYNTFHDVLYHQIPSIFIPQTAAYMDDQGARAQALEQRGAGYLVEPECFQRLEQLIEECLGNDHTADLRQKLAQLDLPAIGNSAAAQLIGAV